MNNQLAIFNFKSTPVRTQLVDNNIWFCLVDVCDSLSLKRGSKVIERLSEDGVRETSLIDNLGRQQSAKFINEPNLYRLVFRSNKPAALQFAKWVYEDVLPTIRKTGGYGVPAPVNMRAIGGMVKRCVNKALTEFLESAPIDKTQPWEVSDQELIYQLHCWHATRNKIDFEKMRELVQENDELKRRLAAIKQAII